jgi:hypothetical protein
MLLDGRQAPPSQNLPDLGGIGVIRPTQLLDGDADVLGGQGASGYGGILHGILQIK